MAGKQTVTETPVTTENVDVVEDASAYDIMLLQEATY